MFPLQISGAAMAKGKTEEPETVIEDVAQPEAEAASFQADLGWALDQLGLADHEVLAHRVYDDRVVVVTTSGAKLVAR